MTTPPDPNIMTASECVLAMVKDIERGHPHPFNTIAAEECITEIANANLLSYPPEMLAVLLAYALVGLVVMGRESLRRDMGEPS